MKICHPFLLLSVLSVITLIGCSTAGTEQVDSAKRTKVKIEFRLSNLEPYSSWTEVELPFGNQKIFVDTDVLLVGSDFVAVETDTNDSGYGVNANLTSAAGSRLKAASKEHLYKFISIFVDDKPRFHFSISQEFGKSFFVPANSLTDANELCSWLENQR